MKRVMDYDTLGLFQRVMREFIHRKQCAFINNKWPELPQIVKERLMNAITSATQGALVKDHKDFWEISHLPKKEMNQIINHARSVYESGALPNVVPRKIITVQRKLAAVDLHARLIRILKDADRRGVLAGQETALEKIRTIVVRLELM